MYKANKKAQMQIFLILFSLIMSIGLISAFYNILAFQNRAKNMMDGVIDAQYFKKDYMLALNMPVDNVTICHKTILKDCNLYLRVPKDNEMVFFKYPEVMIEIEDPKVNISAKMGMGVMDEDTTMAHDPLTVAVIPHAKQIMILPEMRALAGCWEDADYRYCKYVCASPIQINKYREYNSTYDMMIDRMNISQFMGDECLS